MDLLYSLSMILISLSSLFFAVFILNKSEDKRINIYAVLLLLTIFAWALGRAMMDLSADKAFAMFWIRFSYAGSIWMALAFLAFCWVILNKKFNYFIIAPVGLISLILWFLNFTNYFIVDLQPKLSFHFYDVPGIVFNVFSATYTIVLLYAHYELFKGYLSSEGGKKVQIGYLFLASFVGFLPSSTTFPLVFNIPIYPFGVPVIVLYPFILAYAITKHRLMNISVVISRTVAWAITILSLGSIYVLLAWLYRTFVTAQIDWIFLAGTVLYGVLVGVSFQKIRLFLQTTTDRAFIKGWYDYREVLRKVATGLAKALTREDIVKTLYPIFQDDIDISESHLYFLDRSSATFIEWDPKTLEPRKESALTKDYSLVKQVSAQKEVAVFDKKLCVPSFSGGDLVALFNLGKKRSEDEYNDDDIELFRTVSEYVAIALEYIVKPYEEVKERFATTEKKLFETEKQLERSQRLASLGTVAAGVAHEIRNPLAVISLKTQNLPDTEELRDFKNIVIANTERATAIIKQMIMLSKPKERKEIEINLNELIDATLKLFAISRIRLILDLKELPPIKCDPDEMKQVFINLIDNAIHAMPEGGDLTISSKYIEEPPSVQIEISDTGAGIPDEIKEKIFDPFFSTRHEGAGLGLSIAYRIVREHGGSMEFKSKVGKGTTFILKFPAIKT